MDRNQPLNCILLGAGQGLGPGMLSVGRSAVCVGDQGNGRRASPSLFSSMMPFDRQGSGAVIERLGKIL